MISLMTRNCIESALAAHSADDKFGDRIKAIAASQDVLIDDQDVSELADLSGRYIRETIRLLESCCTAAAQARADGLFNPVVGACERFFLQPVDAAPDQGGLFGMVCNAYLCRAVLSLVSESIRQNRGFPLVVADPHSEAPIIRSLIGAEIADALDEAAAEAYAAARLQFIGNSVYGLTGSLRASGRVSDWGASWEEEMSSFGASLGLAFR